MKDIINKLISYKTLSKNEAKSILINISRGKFNSSLISSFNCIYDEKYHIGRTSGF